MFVCVENNVCEAGVCSVYVWWWLNVRESSFSVCIELCPVCFPIVRECVSVLYASADGSLLHPCPALINSKSCIMQH